MEVPEISDHARDSMVIRQIAEPDVRSVLADPLRIVDGNRPGRVVYEGFADVGDPPLKALLRVIVDRNLSPPIVVTVYATRQFRRYGVTP